MKDMMTEETKSKNYIGKVETGFPFQLHLKSTNIRVHSSWTWAMLELFSKLYYLKVKLMHFVGFWNSFEGVTAANIIICMNI